MCPWEKMLTGIVNKWDVRVLTGLNWLMSGSNGRWTLELHECGELLISEQISFYQQGVSSMWLNDTILRQTTDFIFLL